ncbi:MAG: methyltransferase domain-containing protein [Desulfobacteraceae bacterium]|nr:MAG: methyltransferase domain-containing protein [Desulfobacteraceae bacterium]
MLIMDPSVGLSDELFGRLSILIRKELGIKMPESKKNMLQARLQKRIRKLSIGSFAEYCKLVFSPEGKKEELLHLLDVVTTNKTDFFREPKHYEILIEKVLPDLISRYGAGIRMPLKLWSAGCSTGAEPYTLAMVLSDFAGRVKSFRFSILASDVSTRVLEKAKAAIYEERDASPIPIEQKKQYLLRSKDRDCPMVRVIPQLRKLVQFRRINFMTEDFGIRSQLDIIFCRNVIIYFDRATQEEVLKKICRHLRAGGYLFMGHSETLAGMALPLQQTQTTVYRKTG